MQDRSTNTNETHSISVVDTFDYQAALQFAIDGNLVEFNKMVDIFYAQTKKLGASSLVTSLEELLNHSFVIGERHLSISPKTFLIKNSPLLKKHGFTTLFMEGIFYGDKQQELLDEFFTHPTDRELENKVREGLRCPSINHAERWKQNDYRQVAISAIKAGIRVIGIDTKATDQATQSRIASGEPESAWRLSRIRFMNLTACAIIKKHRIEGEKWVVLTGNGHAVDYVCGRTPGIASLFEVPVVAILDKQHTPFSYKLGAHPHTRDLGMEIVLDTYRINSRTLVFEPCFIQNDPVKHDMPFMSFEKKFTTQQYQEALRHYIEYKKAFPLRWLATSQESRQVLHALEHAADDQKRFEIVMAYVRKNFDNALAQALYTVLDRDQALLLRNQSSIVAPSQPTNLPPVATHPAAMFTTTSAPAVTTSSEIESHHTQSTLKQGVAMN